MRRGLCAAAVGVVVALSVAPLFAAPAGAQSSVTVTASKFSMSPAPSAPITTPLVSVSGHFHAAGGFQPVFDWVTVDVVWNKPGAGPSQTYVFCGAPPNVTGVTAAVDKTRQTTVSWDRDGTTPDVQSYYVYRKGPGDKDFAPVLQTLQQNSGARITVVDSGTQYKGGDYQFEVEERRNGQSGDSSTVVVSDKSKSQSNKVTVPDPPPGTPAPPPTQPPSSNGAPPVVKGTPTGVTRSSGFSSSGSSSTATTPTSEAVTPDPGFARGLPYAAGSPAPDNSGNEGDNSAVAVTPGRHKSNSRGIFIPVAAGAILFVGAFHMRILKKRLDEPVGTALS